MGFKSQYEGKRRFSAKVAYQESLEEALGEAVNELQVPGRDEVISAIQNDQWEKDITPDAFKASISKSKHDLMLTDYSPSDFAKMKLFKLQDADIGFALKDIGDKKHAEIVAVYNNSGVKGIGDELIQAAIRQGGRYLDHFDGFLTDLYTRNGFVEYKRDPYNPDYDEGGNFKQKYGPRDVIYRVYKGS
jgi:hypothetical protein